MTCDFCQKEVNEGYSYLCPEPGHDSDHWHFSCFLCAPSMLEPVMLRFGQQHHLNITPENLGQFKASVIDQADKLYGGET